MNCIALIWYISRAIIGTQREQRNRAFKKKYVPKMYMEAMELKCQNLPSFSDFGY